MAVGNEELAYECSHSPIGTVRLKLRQRNRERRQAEKSENGNKYSRRGKKVSPDDLTVARDNSSHGH